MQQLHETEPRPNGEVTSNERESTGIRNERESKQNNDQEPSEGAETCEEPLRPCYSSCLRLPSEEPATGAAAKTSTEETPGQLRGRQISSAQEAEETELNSLQQLNKTNRLIVSPLIDSDDAL